jgi:hypothetical protein
MAGREGQYGVSASNERDGDGRIGGRNGGRDEQDRL